ncbi:MAG: hypothetical protein K6A23_08740 [Butyrivibrio sp.]|nr:hypothetical protein [Butyrivibrio sp.]
MGILSANKKFKGEFGYIKYQRKIGIIRTVIFILIAVLLFLTGLTVFGTQKNFLSILAALICLPAGWSAVNMIMFLKALPCSDSAHEAVLQHAGGLLIHYDHIITSYEKNFNVSASTVLDKNICCYIEDQKADPDDIERHIKKMMAQGGYSNHSIKVFDNLERFCERLDQLDKLRSDKSIDPKAIEDAWVPGTAQTPASVLLSISL